MSYIVANPGIYLREISEDLGLSMGVVQYHIWVLTKNGEVEDFRSGRYRRFFGAARYQEIDQKVISVLRQGTAGRILTLLSAGRPLTHSDLAVLLGVTSQALTWQMKRLKAMGIIETTSFRDSGATSYHLADGVSERVGAVVSAIPTAKVGAHLVSIETPSPLSRESR